MHEAAKRGNVEFLKECLENKVSVNSLDQASNTPLHWVTYNLTTGKSFNRKKNYFWSL